MASILIIDDEAVIRETLSDWLEREGHTTETAITGEEGIEKERATRFDIAIVDLKLPGMDGIKALRELKRINPDIPIIMITAYGTIETAVEAIKQGAYDYFTKPFNLEEISLIVKKIVEHQKLIAENILLRKQLQERYNFKNIVGKSPKMRKIFEVIEDVADSGTTILIQGESGTGKEVIARAIHQRSSRVKGPFITANCAAIPENLLESELFGYEKGAFTGAVQTRKGRFELANGGTLFLDEIADMKLDAQVDLLRVLEEREFRRVGGSKLIKTDARIIASTNKDIEVQIAQGNFREDLYYRLSVISVQLPPLRERKEDIPLLIQHFLKKYGKKSVGTLRAMSLLKGVSREAMDLLTKYNWRGNVRELENVIERAMVLGKEELLMPDDLPEIIKKPPLGVGTTPIRRACGVSIVAGQHLFDKSLQEIEKEYIVNVLQETGWNLSKSAKTLKINRTTLYNKIRDYKIKRLSARGGSAFGGED